MEQKLTEKALRELSMEERARRAASRTLELTGDDVAASLGREPNWLEMAEVVLDFGNVYGNDLEAIEWLRERGYRGVARFLENKK